MLTVSLGSAFTQPNMCCCHRFNCLKSSERGAAFKHNVMICSIVNSNLHLRCFTVLMFNKVLLTSKPITNPFSLHGDRVTDRVNVFK